MKEGNIGGRGFAQELVSGTTRPCKKLPLEDKSSLSILASLGESMEEEDENARVKSQLEGYHVLKPKKD